MFEQSAMEWLWIFFIMILYSACQVLRLAIFNEEKVRPAEIS